MNKVQRDKNTSVVEKMKLHWILSFLLIFSFCFVQAYSYFVNDIEEPKNNITLNVHPQFKNETLIWYNKSDEGIKEWVDMLDEFTKVYRFSQLTPGRQNNTIMCDYGKTIPKDKFCIIDMSSWFPCTIEVKFDYETSPCVFLEVFKDEYWNIEFFQNTTELPKDMPETLVEYIEKKFVENPETIKTLWVLCDGKSPADKENFKEIRYNPMNGFPNYLFHNYNGEGYIRPLMAIQLVGVQIGVIVEFECKFWTRNESGSKSFELLIDN